MRGGLRKGEGLKGAWVKGGGVIGKGAWLKGFQVFQVRFEVVQVRWAWLLQGF